VVRRNRRAGVQCWRESAWSDSEAMFCRPLGTDSQATVLSRCEARRSRFARRCSVCDSRPSSRNRVERRKLERASRLVRVAGRVPSRERSDPGNGRESEREEQWTLGGEDVVTKKRIKVSTKRPGLLAPLSHHVAHNPLVTVWRTSLRLRPHRSACSTVQS
jgi:hypothetical protein